MKRVIVLLLLMLPLLFGCTETIELKNVDTDVENSLINKISQTIGEEPIDFQPYNADISWTPDAVYQFQSKMNSLLPTLNLLGEIENIEPKKYIFVQYDDIALYILLEKKTGDNIILKAENKYYLYNGGEKEVREIVDLVTNYK